MYDLSEQKYKQTIHSLVLVWNNDKTAAIDLLPTEPIHLKAIL